jgi:hypothetical protein
MWDMPISFKSLSANATPLVNLLCKYLNDAIPNFSPSFLSPSKKVV